MRKNLPDHVRAKVGNADAQLGDVAARRILSALSIPVKLRSKLAWKLTETSDSWPLAKNLLRRICSKRGVEVGDIRLYRGTETTALRMLCESMEENDLLVYADKDSNSPRAMWKTTDYCAGMLFAAEKPYEVHLLEFDKVAVAADVSNFITKASDEEIAELDQEIADVIRGD